MLELSPTVGDKKSISLVHTFILCYVIAWSARRFTDLPLIFALSLALFTVVFIQPCIDLFFELEEVDDF